MRHDGAAHEPPWDPMGHGASCLGRLRRGISHRCALWAPIGFPMMPHKQETHRGPWGLVGSRGALWGLMGAVSVVYEAP